MKRLIVTKIFVFLFTLCSLAQQKEFEYFNITQAEGLPSNEAYYVFRDSKNFMWFATDKGVVRFNGGKMDRFDLPDNVIFKIYEDYKSRIWFFSHTGKLAYFYNEKIYPYKFNDSITKYIKSILISDAYVNEEDEIVISTYRHNNYKITASGKIEIKKFFYDDQESDTTKYKILKIDNYYLFSQTIYSTNGRKNFLSLNINNTHNYTVASFNEGNVIVHCNEVDKMEDYVFASDKILIKLNKDGSYKLRRFDANIFALYRDRENRIWLGFQKSGLLVLNENLEQVYEDPLLKGKSVTSITSDFENGIWIATLENGVYYLKNDLVNRMIGADLLNQPITRILTNKKSSLVIANNYGIYLMVNNKIFNLINKANILISDLFVYKNNLLVGGLFINKISVSHDFIFRKNNIPFYNKIFLLTSNSDIYRNNDTSYYVNHYTSLFNKNFKKLIQLNEDKVYRANIDNKQSLAVNPGFIYLDFKGQLWQANKLGINKVNAAFDSIIPFQENNPLFKKGITCMRQMPNGIYTIGIRFGGIALMQDTTIVGTITEQDGLLNNAILYLLPINNQLWAATANGVSVIQFQSYNPLQYTITNIGKNEGLYNMIIYQLLPYQGNILAATSKGIYTIENPDFFLNQQPKPIPFYITSVTTYKGDTFNVSSVTLPFNKNRVIIKYNAISFKSPEEIKYYYRFEKDDSTWRESNTVELLLENLAPGIYNLEIKAVIPNQHRSSMIQKLNIRINKPWWFTNLFIILSALIIACSIYLYVKWRLNRIRKAGIEKNNLYKKMLDLENTALRSQMNPHFIFNCLTSIQQLIVQNKTIDANEYLVKFARLIRKTLDISNRPFINIEEETDYLTEYLTMEQLRMPGQFEFTIEVDSTLNTTQTLIPNMMLQPIVENAIRHGIKHLNNKKGLVTIMFIKEHTGILCKITDNGVGRNNTYQSNYTFKEHKSYGMEIVRKRLAALHDNNSLQHLIINDLQDDEQKPTGTQVIIYLPYKLKTT